jgi:catechol 2,3-dioxygenase-like lactoylglutathione lyase family enzyme
VGHAGVPVHERATFTREEMALSTLFHIGLTVTDLDRSTAFYRDVVGLRDDYDWSSRTDWSGADFSTTSGGVRYIGIKSEAFAELTSNPAAEILTAYLRSDNGLLLQLTQYVAGGGGTVELAHDRAGSPHFCFYVEDSAAKRAELEQRGDVKILSDLVQITPHMRSFYVADPDGVPIELLQHSVPTGSDNGASSEASKVAAQR